MAPDGNGSRGRLSLVAVLDGAVRLIERDGARALTMRALGRDLGVEAMALYRYVPNFDALLDSVADGGAVSREDLVAYRVVETVPRSVPVDRYTVHARGDDLDDLLSTMATAARQMPGDPRTDPVSARGLVQALRAPDKRAETTNIVAVDHQGDGCAITTSLGLGSGVWVDGFGVHLNSMIGEGELVIIVAGSPPGVAGHTNMIRVRRIGAPL